MQKKYSFFKLLKDTLPNSPIIIHSVFMGIIVFIILPILLLTTRFEGKEDSVTYSLIGYSIFYIFIIWGKTLFNLFIWNQNRNTFIKENEHLSLELYNSKKINFKNISKINNQSEAIMMNIGGFYGKSLLVFDLCDIIKVNKSIIIYGKGNLGALGKGVAKPFEINFDNFPFTRNNSVKIIEHNETNNNHKFVLKGVNSFGEFEFEMTIYNLKLD